MLTNGLGAAGAPKVLLNLCKHLPDLGFSVSIMNMGSATELIPEIEETGANIINIRGQIPATFVDILRTLSELSPDILHTHMMLANSLGRIAGVLMRIPTVSTIHTSYPDRTFAGKLLDYSTSSLPQANIPVSHAVRDSLPLGFGFSSNQPVIHNCIDLDYVTGLGRCSWGSQAWMDSVCESDPIIANVARFDPKKCRRDLIDSMKIVVQEYPGAQLLLSGKINELGRKLQKHVSDEGLDKNVNFLGFVENPYSLYYHSDVISFSSRSEGFSIGLLEAMAFGKPVVATKIAPFVEAIGPDHNYVPLGDSRAMGDEIVRLLSDEAHCDSVSKHIENRLVTHFSGDKAAKRYAEVYRSLVSGGSSGLNPI